MRFAALCACLLLCFSLRFVAANELATSDGTGVQADSPMINTLSSASETAPEQKQSSILRLLDNIDTIEFSAGNSQQILKNPQGFDVATEVYDDGRAPVSFFALFDNTRISTIAYGPSNMQPLVRRRYALSYDSSVDYEGLKLMAISADFGLVAENVSNLARINFGASLGAGLTRAESYSDSTVHPLIQASIHSRISLWKIFIEVIATERMNFASELDDRDARPRLRNISFMLGFRIR